MFEVENISVSYGTVNVLSNISFNVDENEIVTIIGPNGHGKTTLLKSIVGINPPHSGSIKFYGENIEKDPPHEIVKRGIMLLPERGGYLSNFTVLENLKLGAYANQKEIKVNLEKVFKLFPWLKERTDQIAWTLSGGERRMLAMARCLMSRIKLLLLDEITLGVAPIIQIELKTIIKTIKDMGFSLIISESNILFVEDIADKFLLLKNNKLTPIEKEVLQKNAMTLFL